MLTAGHLLIGSSLKEIPFINEQQQNYSLLKRYRYITTLKERFWMIMFEINSKQQNG